MCVLFEWNFDFSAFFSISIDFFIKKFYNYKVNVCAELTKYA